MQYIGTFTPQTVPNGTFDTKTTQGKLLFSNESCNNLKITLSNGYSFKLPAGGERLICVNQQNTIIQYSTISMLNIPCLNEVDVESYEPGETIHETYPNAMARQTVIGNGVKLGTTATSIVSDNTNNPGTSIISAQPSDVAIGFTWAADNSGNLLINSDNAGVLQRLFQLIAGASPAVNIASAGILTTVLDKLQINNDAFVNGNHSLGTGGLLYSTLTGAFGLSIMGKSSQDNGNIFTDGNGNQTVKSINFTSGSLSRIKFGVAMNVTNAGVTVTHGLGVQPDVVFCTIDNVGVSDTAQAGTVGATTFVVSTSSATARTVWWLALKA